MEMLSLASGIIILLFGLMMKTYSPSTTVLRYVSDSENISYYVRLALDRGTVGLFFFPITLLLSSLILDVHRNVTYDKDVLRITTLYNTKHEELEGNLKQEMVRRVEIEELIHKLSMQTPDDSSESKRITK